MSGQLWRHISTTFARNGDFEKMTHFFLVDHAGPFLAVGARSSRRSGDTADSGIAYRIYNAELSDLAVFGHRW